MEYYIFTLPEHVSSMFQGKIWRRGKELYEEDGVKEVYAFDEKTVICKVKGTILYTVIIHFDEGEVSLECNCDYMDDCKHEVAALMYLKDHQMCIRDSWNSVYLICSHQKECICYQDYGSIGCNWYFRGLYWHILRRGEGL